MSSRTTAGSVARPGRARQCGATSGPCLPEGGQRLLPQTFGGRSRRERQEDPELRLQEADLQARIAIAQKQQMPRQRPGSALTWRVWRGASGEAEKAAGKEEDYDRAEQEERGRELQGDP